MKTTHRTSSIASMLPMLPGTIGGTGKAATAPVNLGADRTTVTQPQPEEQELRLGDVLRSSGSGKDYIVDRMLAGGRVSCTPLDPEPIRYERTDGSVCEYNTFKPLDIPAKSKVVLIERRGEDGLAKFFASKVARREVTGNPGNEQRTRTVKTKTEKHDETGLPVHPYDRACCEELLKGGSPDEIAARVVARFADEKDAPTRKYRTNPVNYTKYHADYVADMTAAGLLKGGAAVVPSPSKAAPVVTLAASGPEKAKVAPAGQPEAAAKPLAATPKPKKGAAAKALDFVGKGVSKLRPLAAGGKKPVSKPRGGLAAAV